MKRSLAGRPGLALLLLLAAACGGSPALTIDIELAASDTGSTTVNPLVQINNDIQARTSAGIYFMFEQLKCPPASISDVVSGGNVVKIPDPDLGEAGSSPLSDQFDVQTNKLLPSTFYRVTMYERYLTGIRYQGVGDCPINLALSSLNHSTICFGLANPVPICPGLTAQWANCPGVTDTTYCQ